MFTFNEVLVDCQAPTNTRYISRIYSIVNCSIIRNSELFAVLLGEAQSLANLVNPVAANADGRVRTENRRLRDALGGVLSEAAWRLYINSKFGDIANRTEFTSAAVQIDVQLQNGELIEVRSSFPRNGVRFAICNEAHNFRNLGPYSNAIKPGEIIKHFYAGVLYTTSKTRLLEDNAIELSLVGGSTWEMMLNEGYDTDLVAEDDINNRRTRYRVIDFKDALDANGFLDAITAKGYNRL